MFGSRGRSSRLNCARNSFSRLDESTELNCVTAVSVLSFSSALFATVLVVGLDATMPFSPVFVLRLTRAQS